VEVHDEIGRVASGAQLSGSDRSLVQRAGEVLLVVLIFFEERLEPNHWELDDWYADRAVINTFLAVIPSCSLHKQAVDIHSNLWGRLDVSTEERHNVSLEDKRVNGGLCLSGVHLQRGCDEALREVERWQPVDIRGSVIQPVAYEFDTANKVLHPAT